MNREIKIKAVQAKLKHMSNQGWFCICTIREAAQLLEVNISSEQLSFLNLLHCVHFADMDKELAEEMQIVVEEILGQEPFVIRAGRNFLGQGKTTQFKLVENNA